MPDDPSRADDARLIASLTKGYREATAAVEELTARAERAEAGLAGVRRLHPSFEETNARQHTLCPECATPAPCRTRREVDPEPNAVEIVELTKGEYDKAVANALAALGLTYEQLAEQARTGDYHPPAARPLWLRIKPAPEGDRDPYRVCAECGHVFPTEADLYRDYEQKTIEVGLTFILKRAKYIRFCPHCFHNF